ncbi:hypothetical protein [Nocardioides houyundeii]|uniref:hypothetical protein n=1 Tax=Nocardioides houyundeii TaxID=2045452 RepID=UPI000C7740CF|nr:hypothetical protein [Nocardioides houyundeii]
MTLPPHQESSTEVDDFWNLAKFHAKLNHMPGYFGPTALESVRPPVWSFGETTEEADRTLDALLDGSRTSTSTPQADYVAAQEPLPEVGALGIVLDGRGQPRALVATTAVDVVQGDVVEHFSVLYAAGH